MKPKKVRKKFSYYMANVGIDTVLHGEEGYALAEA
jgi:hypothetical protein